MAGKPPEILEVDSSQLQELLRRADGRALQEEDYETIRLVCESYVYVTGLLGDKKTSLARLRKMLFGAQTEKTAAVVASAGDDAASDRSESDESDAEGNPKPKRPGHGRHGASDYRGAQRIDVAHASMDAGDPCPECRQGTLYESCGPQVLVRIVGQAPLQARVYRLQRLRCHLCGKVFTAEAPQDAGARKYDATAASMIAVLKYGSGMPFNRLAGLQRNLEIPLPASTQWDVIAAFAPAVHPAFQELIRHAAQGDVLYNDDTTIKILEFMGKRAPPADDPSTRTGLFTSGIVATGEGRRLALFFSGRQHAGENLADVLQQRAEDLQRPIQMCDALSRNMTGELKTIVANCLVHGRRQFVDVYDRFPDECRYVLKALKVVYRNEAIAHEQQLTPDKRLRFHRMKSRQAMDRLHHWLNRQFEEKLVEPNSALGGAIQYMLNHWEKLTLFLRQAGAPLDNNLCERVLKKAILHRKNALFYKSQNGARVGDMYMSLIHTCELCQVSPFDYLTELMRHADELAANPAAWMPWNYRDALAPC